MTVLETRFDTILPTLATKADLETLRVEMEKLRAELFKAVSDAMRWMMGLVLTLFIGALGVNVTLYISLKGLIVNHPHVAAAVERAPAPPVPIKQP
ncbi:MAG: hypothetical protein V4631_08480 [Pseudomonadota bacterium]